MVHIFWGSTLRFERGDGDELPLAILGCLFEISPNFLEVPWLLCLMPGLPLVSS